MDITRTHTHTHRKIVLYYGEVDVLDVSEEKPSGEVIEIKGLKEDGQEKNLYLSVEKAIAIAEEPTDTDFKYSQKYILETLITILCVNPVLITAIHHTFPPMFII